MIPAIPTMTPTAALMNARGLRCHSAHKLRAIRRGHGGNSEYGEKNPFDGPFCMSQSFAFSQMRNRMINMSGPRPNFGRPNHKRSSESAQQEATHAV